MSDLKAAEAKIEARGGMHGIIARILEDLHSTDPAYQDRDASGGKS